MKLIIAGGRDFNNRELMVTKLQELVRQDKIPESPELVCGMARGADIMAWQLWNANCMTVHEFAADWDRLGKRAGFVRNAEMAEFADALIAFWDGKSRGTKHMIDIMSRYKDKQVFVVRY